MGTDSTSPSTTRIRRSVGRAVIEGGPSAACSICGSGVGASVAANKIPGIRAAICHDVVLGPPGRGARRHERPRAGRPRSWARPWPTSWCGPSWPRASRPRSGTRGVSQKVKAIEKRYAEGTRPSHGEIVMSPLIRFRRVANPVAALQQYGQSVWLDFIRAQPDRERRAEAPGRRGRPRRRDLEPRHLREGHRRQRRLRSAIEEISEGPGLGAKEVYERLAVKDIQDAADVLRPVYDRTEAHDGYVSLEVSPDLANDTDGTWRRRAGSGTTVARPNVMIKVPATPEGVPAIRTLHQRGHQRQRHAALRPRRVRGGGPRLSSRASRRACQRDSRVDHVASVASFFVSRIDTLVDALDRREAEDGSTEPTRPASSACWARSRSPTRSSPTRATRRSSPARAGRPCAAKGAQAQRVLWASTGTKNPHYSDVLYVEELIGPDTVNTVPPGDARRLPRPRPSARRASRRTSPARRPAAGRPRESRDLAARRSPTSCSTTASRSSWSRSRSCWRPSSAAAARPTRRASTPDATRCRAARRRRGARRGSRTGTREGGTRRLCRRATPRSGRATDEASWLGWLGHRRAAARRARGRCASLQAEVRGEGLHPRAAPRHGRLEPVPRGVEGDLRHDPGCPELLVLDSTDPAQVRALEEKVDLAKTLFIVSSKSGSTLEPNIFKAYFFDRVKQAVGADKAGRRFIAITDPGSNLEKEAQGRRLPPHLLRHEEHRRPLLGALELRHGARRRSWASTSSGCSTRPSAWCTPARPGCPPRRTPGSCWARSWAWLATTGRRQADARRLARHLRSRRLARAAHRRVHGQGGQGHHPRRPRDASAAPTRLRRRSPLRLPAPRRRRRTPHRTPPWPRSETGGQAGGARSRWRRSTTSPRSSSAGRSRRRSPARSSGINPFNQPDVEASKIATKALTARVREDRQAPAEAPFFEGEGVKLFADPTNADALQTRRGRRAVARRLPEGASRAPRRGRLLRAARLRGR